MESKGNHPELRNPFNHIIRELVRPLITEMIWTFTALKEVCTVNQSRSISTKNIKADNSAASPHWRSWDQEHHQIWPSHRTIKILPTCSSTNRKDKTSGSSNLAIKQTSQRKLKQICHLLTFNISQSQLRLKVHPNLIIKHQKSKISAQKREISNQLRRSIHYQKSWSTSTPMKTTWAKDHHLLAREEDAKENVMTFTSWKPRRESSSSAEHCARPRKMVWPLRIARDLGTK